MTTERELRARAQICYAEVEEDEVDKGISMRRKDGKNEYEKNTTKK
jgi:hypothetical protein